MGLDIWFTKKTTIELKLSYDERKELIKNLRKAEKQLEDCEKVISNMEKEIANIEILFIN